MDVENFVSETLQQVLRGLTNANQATEEPSMHNRFGTTGNSGVQEPPAGLFQDFHGNFYTVIEFDLAVSVANEGGAGGKLKVPFFEAGGEGKRTSETVSRVKFSIPTRLS